MKIFVAEDQGHPEARKYCIENNIGMVYSPHRWNNPKTKNWIFDNGAYPAFIRGEDQLNENSFYRCLNLIPSLSNPPYFVVVPDIINPSDPDNFKKSLRFSLKHIVKIPDGLNKYFVIQPGMKTSDVSQLVDQVTGFFLGGGDPRYQKRTGKYWREYTEDNNLKLHIGAIGTKEGYDFAYMIGADSVDGSTPMRHQDLERIPMWRAAPLGNQIRLNFAEHSFCETAGKKL